MKSTGKRRTKKQPIPALTGDQLRDAVAKMLRLKNRGAKLYTDAGKLSEQIAVSLSAGESITIETKRGRKTVLQRVTMVDPFLDKDTGQPGKQWKHVPVDRFAFEVEDIAEAEPLPVTEATVEPTGLMTPNDVRANETEA